jgi:predicted TIM-barrel fold metal-dependent hydrolase
VLQIHAGWRLLETCQAAITNLPGPVLLDHFGGYRALAPDAQAAAVAIERLLAQPHVFLKLSAPYHQQVDWSRADTLSPLIGHWLAARAGALVWGSDWPHTQGPGRSTASGEHSEAFRKVDEAGLVALAGAWVTEAEARTALWWETPQKLFWHDVQTHREPRG